MTLSSRATVWLKYLIVAAMFTAGVLLSPRLPEQIPTHWGFTGGPDGFMPKPWGVFLIPLLALAMAVLFPLFRRMDPKAQNYALFAPTWNMLQLSFVSFFAYIFAMQMYLSLSPLPSPNFVGRFITAGIGALFIVIGNSMGKIRQNFFVGLRTPWSLSDPEVWNRSQRFGGWMFVLGGLVVLVEAFVWVLAIPVFCVVLTAIVLLPVGYSYLLYRQRHSTIRPIDN